ncbi:MAG TPA: cytochrome c oxidase assembly protein [Kiloniellales bacterium]
MAAGSSRRNARTGLVLAGIAAGMVGLAFASVPLYRLFCQVTGFGGTTQVAAQAPAETIDRTVTIRFNADVDPKLPWSFQPNQRQISLRVGETGLATFTARNLTSAPVTGTAIFNVTPLKAGRYFDKVQCFCFDEQRLEAGQEVEMAVSFFVDPAIMDDRNLDEVKTITLSYTFFRARDDYDGAAGNTVNTPPRDATRRTAAATGAPARIQ